MYTNVRQPHSRAPFYDMQEILKREIYAQGNVLVSTDAGATMDSRQSPTAAPQQPVPQQSAPGFQDINILLDSVTTNSNVGGGNLTFSVQALNNNNDIANCIAITVYPFYFPRNLLDTTVHPNYYYFRRVYMLLSSISASDCFTASGYKYHFEFEVAEINSVAVLLKPIQPIYYFKNAVSAISTLTMQFLIPPTGAWVNLPPTVLRVTSVPNSNPAQFVADDTSQISAVDLQAPGVAVWFMDFASNVTDANVRVVDGRGWYVDNIIDATHFSISALDLTGVVATPAKMIVGPNRVTVPLRFTVQTEKKQNALDYVHV